MGTDQSKTDGPQDGPSAGRKSWPGHVEDSCWAGWWTDTDVGLDPGLADGMHGTDGLVNGTVDGWTDELQARQYWYRTFRQTRWWLDLWTDESDDRTSRLPTEMDWVDGLSDQWTNGRTGLSWIQTRGLLDRWDDYWIGGTTTGLLTSRHWGTWWNNNEGAELLDC